MKMTLTAAAMLQKLRDSGKLDEIAKNIQKEKEKQTKGANPKN